MRRESDSATGLGYALLVLLFVGVPLGCWLAVVVVRHLTP